MGIALSFLFELSTAVRYWLHASQRTISIWHVGDDVCSVFQEKEYFCHCFVRSDYLSAVLISDDEYPQRVAFTLLSKILDEYKLHSSSISSSSSPPQNTVWLDDLLFKVRPSKYSCFSHCSSSRKKLFRSISQSRARKSE